MLLKEWNFALDDTKKRGAFLHNGVEGETISVPHTWNASDKYQNYRGIAWYGTELFLQELAPVNLLRFGAVYHDADVYINGVHTFRHADSGYTPFSFDATRFLRKGKNRIAVRCSNAPSATALPNKGDFDWADDGGLIRAVEFLQKERRDVKDCRITPSILQYLPQGRCRAELTVDASLFAEETQLQELSILDRAGRTVLTQNVLFQNGRLHACLTLENALLWEPEFPNLYTLAFRSGSSRSKFRFGVRELTVRGDQILLNGKEIRLLGMEWMPGSCPDCGMAEPQEVSEQFLQLLKEANCNFTRFHWQQDNAIYEWCDAHGLMVQEEIPIWGKPKAPGKRIEQTAKQQATEMVAAHSNHPSIVCWGVGNELNGHSKRTVAYVREMVAFFKQLDSSRLANYVSSTLDYKKRTPMESEHDATLYGDICMWNEYMGTWNHRDHYDEGMRFVCDQAKGKPLVITEFGLCEPAFDGGDERRAAIFREKVALYRKYQLNGWIYFSLNDYRTHMGEDGQGRFQKRVHGSTDLYGALKPSYAVVRDQNAGLE